MAISKPILEQTLDEYRKQMSVNGKSTLTDKNSIESNDFTVDGVFYSAKYAGEVFKKQGRGNLIITGSISSHVVNVPCDQPVSATCILAMG
jgi:sorbose reductase